MTAAGRTEPYPSGMARGHAPQPDPSADLLRGAGLRVTEVRLGVVRALAKSQAAGRTLLAADVAAALPSADRVTVYRTLNTLVEAGIAHRVDPGDRIFRFGLTDHAHCSAEHHDHEHPHLVCESCGVVQCLDDAVVTITPRGGGHAATWRHIRQQHVTLRGMCERCGAKG